jgi:cell wall-associated NlpC family hydrolase
VFEQTATHAASTSATATVQPRAVVQARVAPSVGQRAVALAARQAGKPYRYGSTGPSAFDCSGFTTYIFNTQLGKRLPRTSAAQAAALPKVAQAAKQPGDLLFFRSGSRVTHVGIYAGGGRMWAAPTSGDRVKLQSIYSSRYSVGRVV